MISIEQHFIDLFGGDMRNNRLLEQKWMQYRLQQSESELVYVAGRVLGMGLTCTVEMARDKCANATRQ